jgi:protein tyrosine/serine phosphatase
VEDYGSMEAYIRDGLGITDEEVEELRSQLLD